MANLTGIDKKLNFCFRSFNTNVCSLLEMTSLSVQDRSAYRELFLIADVEKKSFLIKREAMSFFSKTGIPGAFLEEVTI